jgi:hypothetical protein
MRVSVGGVCVYTCVCVFTTAMERHCLLIQRQHRHQHHARPRGSDPVSISLKLACLLAALHVVFTFVRLPTTNHVQNRLAVSEPRHRHAL